MTADPIYLDHNATTPVDARVLSAMLEYWGEHYGNPSSAHAYGDRPRGALALARRQVADLLRARPAEIVFTGSGTEADHLAILGVARARRADGDHIVTQATEHPAVLEACRVLATEHGFRVTVLSVDAAGLVHPEALESALTSRTVLVSIMHANNETGTVQPIRTLAALAHRVGATFHTDAAQSAGKILTDVDDLGVDLMTVVGHKMYGPKGVGALFVRSGTPIVAVVPGGGQERGLRGGTENVPLIAGLGHACELSVEEGIPAMARVSALRDRLHQRLEELLPDRVQINGHRTNRLPNTLNVSITGTRGDLVLTACPGLAASTGSACHESVSRPSPVLTAMGIDGVRAGAALRFSLGRTTTRGDVDTAAADVATAVHRFSA